eukprot:8952516-Pyramimonas_sp.AAC.1
MSEAKGIEIVDSPIFEMGKGEGASRRPPHGPALQDRDFLSEPPEPQRGSRMKLPDPLTSLQEGPRMPPQETPGDPREQP